LATVKPAWGAGVNGELWAGGPGVGAVALNLAQQVVGSFNSSYVGAVPFI
jgi:hypothetical protein